MLDGMSAELSSPSKRKRDWEDESGPHHKRTAVANIEEYIPSAQIFTKDRTTRSAYCQNNIRRLNVPSPQRILRTNLDTSCRLRPEREDVRSNCARSLARAYPSQSEWLLQAPMNPPVASESLMLGNTRKGKANQMLPRQSIQVPDTTYSWYGSSSQGSGPQQARYSPARSTVASQQTQDQCGSLQGLSHTLNYGHLTGKNLYQRSTAEQKNSANNKLNAAYPLVLPYPLLNIQMESSGAYAGTYDHALSSTPVSRQWDNKKDVERGISQQYLCLISRQLHTGYPARVPIIPADYLFDFKGGCCLFQPCDIWMLRHLNRLSRYETYSEFLQLGKQMQNSDHSQDVYWNAWAMLIERSEELRRAEYAFYKTFEQSDGETNEDRQRRIGRWAVVTAVQAYSYSQKHAKNKPPVERLVVEDDDDTQQTSCFDEAVLVGGLDGDSDQIIRSKQNMQEKPDHVRCAKKENDKLAYWQRSWPGDLVSLPDHPFPHVEDYTLGENGRYQCFHKSFDCGEGKCKHKCCKNGYNAKGLKRAIQKAIQIYKSQVERLIKNGNLDARHKFWKNTCNEAMRKGDIGQIPKARKNRGG